jgi:hypothetical protein
MGKITGAVVGNVDVLRRGNARPVHRAVVGGSTESATMSAIRYRPPRDGRADRARRRTSIVPRASVYTSAGSPLGLCSLKRCQRWAGVGGQRSPVRRVDRSSVEAVAARLTHEQQDSRRCRTIGPSWLGSMCSSARPRGSSSAEVRKRHPGRVPCGRSSTTRAAGAARREMAG